MQILIDLYASNEGVFHSNEKAKHDWERFRLLELLTNLYKKGFRINGLYGRFVYGNANHDIVDCGKPGQCLPPIMPVVDGIFATKGVMAVIYTDKKYIVFADSYFLAPRFCNDREVRPLSIFDVVNNFDSLIVNEDDVILQKLYHEQYKLHHKKSENELC